MGCTESTASAKDYRRLVARRDREILQNDNSLSGTTTTQGESDIYGIESSTNSNQNQRNPLSYQTSSDSEPEQAMHHRNLHHTQCAKTTPRTNDFDTVLPEELSETISSLLSSEQDSESIASDARAPSPMLWIDQGDRTPPPKLPAWENPLGRVLSHTSLLVRENSEEQGEGNPLGLPRPCTFKTHNAQDLR